MSLLIRDRWFCIEYIIVFIFFADTEVVTKIDTQPPCVRLAETTGIDRALVKGEIIFVGSKHIAEAQRYYQLLL